MLVRRWWLSVNKGTKQAVTSGFVTTMTSFTLYMAIWSVVSVKVLMGMALVFSSYFDLIGTLVITFFVSSIVMRRRLVSSSKVCLLFLIGLCPLWLISLCVFHTCHMWLCIMENTKISHPLSVLTFYISGYSRKPSDHHHLLKLIQYNLG